jgi:hypothetical protein
MCVQQLPSKIRQPVSNPVQRQQLSGEPAIGSRPQRTAVRCRWGRGKAGIHPVDAEQPIEERHRSRRRLLGLRPRRAGHLGDEAPTAGHVVGHEVSAGSGYD